MARKTRREIIVTPELLKQVSSDNIGLMHEFIDYLKSTGKATTTIHAYTEDLKIFFVWNVLNNNNKFFVDYTKRDVMKYQNYLVNTLEQSPNRVRRLKAVLSSVSNFIESMMDDIYPQFRNIINKVPSPSKQPVREKTVFEDEQIEKLLQDLVEQQQYQKACILALAAASGARKSELLRFKPEYFTDENIIYGSLYKTPEKIKTKGRGKGKFINKYVIVAKFKPYLDLWLKQRTELGIECEDLFVHKRKGQWKPLTTVTLDSFAETFTKMAGVDFYWHSLRHYFTTSMCKCNIPHSVIKDIVGWESVNMVTTYNDTEVDEELGKYFNTDGMKKVEHSTLCNI